MVALLSLNSSNKERENALACPRPFVVGMTREQEEKTKKKTLFFFSFLLNALPQPRKQRLSTVPALTSVKQSLLPNRRQHSLPTSEWGNSGRMEWELKWELEWELGWELG